ncbi:MAG: glucose-6-phosphate isomerase family protein [Acidimicrobiales bacterium]
MTDAQLALSHIARSISTDSGRVGRVTRPTESRQVRVSDLAELFADGSAVEALLRTEDPVVYEVDMVEPPGTPKDQLSFGTTVLHPGSIGGEFFFTRGHQHVPASFPEIYFVCNGEGILVLADLRGDTIATTQVPLMAGTVVYVDGAYAHRVVNTSDADLVFFSAWLMATGHDYETVAQRGFGVRVTVDGAAAVAEARLSSADGR